MLYERSAAPLSTRHLLLCTFLVVVPISYAEHQPAKDPLLLRVSSARSAADLGLVDFLINEFRKTRSGTRVTVQSKGVLQVFKDGRDGAADLLITHHQAEERRSLDQGYVSQQAQIMYTEYAVFGPPG